MKDDFRPSAAQPNPPKDKRVYIKHKEHGEDMSHENERVHTANKATEDRGTLDLTFLIEEHKKEIWEYKKKEANWLKTDNILQGSKKIIDELSTKLIGLARRIQELEYDNATYKKEIEKMLAEKIK
tara:strand:+ start:328 stop:705 length:378 start_codon:yes stop_codon:yes gene_type:complete